MILVTGASGFIGFSIIEKLIEDGSYKIRGVVRRSGVNLPFGIERVLADLAPSTDWTDALKNVDVLVHAAARVHVMRESHPLPLTEFRRVNVLGSLKLARQAAAAGVRRFVFISSIGVNGVETLDQPFTADDMAAPHSPYARSKHEAELGLLDLSSSTGMEVVVIRSPLVYGRNAPGNFNLLMRAVRLGIPLPLGAIHNQRSLVALDNLVDLITTCLNHPAATGRTFLVSDGEDVSTTDLLRRMGKAMGRPARLIPVPASWLKLAANIVGKQDVAQRLCGSLQVDIEKTCRLLGWRPPLTLDQGLKKAAGTAPFTKD